MLGHDGDFCRATSLSDGRIMCVNGCGFIAPFAAVSVPADMPYSLKSLLATMLGERELHAPYLKLTLATFGPHASSNLAAACAQGNEGTILNHGMLILSADRHGLSKLQVTFQADELQAVPEDFTCLKNNALDHETEQFLRNLTLHSCPPALVKAIGKLISIGFKVRVQDFSTGSYRRVQLHCGGNIAGTSVPKGIMVEATYLV
jgi:hypothetical protein